MPDKPKKKNLPILKLLKRTILVVFLVFVLLILFIRSRWGQHIIVSKATSYVSNKTNTKVDIEKLYLSFSGNLLLKGLYLEDKKGDTLVYSKNIEASVALYPLIKGEAFNLKSLEWDGLKARVYRTDTISKFNYDFLIDAFASADTIPQEDDSSSLKIALGNINLKAIDITYNDAVLGIESGLKLKALNVETDAIDLEAMRFDINNITLTDADINYLQTKPAPVSTDTSRSTLPFVSLKSLKINNSNLVYHSIPEHLDTNLAIDTFVLEAPTLDLEHQTIILNTLELKNTVIAFQQLKPTEEKPSTSPTDFEWPAWNITANNIDLEHNQIDLKTGKSPSVKNTFNAEDIQLKDLNFKAENINYKSENASATINTASFKDRSGFHLADFNAALQLSNTELDIKKLSIATNNNSISSDIHINYKALADFIKTPDQAHIALQAYKLSVNPKDAFYFLPELEKNTYINTLSRKQLTGDININGTLGDLSIPKTQINWGANTKLLVKGAIKNLPNTETLTLDLKELNFDTSKTDALAFVNTDSLGVEIPKHINLKGYIKGGVNAFKTNLKLTIPEGNIAVNGNYKNTNTMAFNGVIDVNNLQLDKILKNEKLGSYTFTTTLKGTGSNLNTLNAELSTNFKKLVYNNQDYSKLKLDGSIKNGTGEVALNFKDENLDVDLNTEIQLDSLASTYHSTLKVNGIDFKALNLSKEDIRAKFNLILNVKGNSMSNLKIDGEITDALAVKNSKPYVLGDMAITSVLTNETTKFSIESNPINATLDSNTNPTKLIAAIQNQFNSYFENATISEENKDVSNVNMQFSATIKQAPILKALFLPELTTMSPVNIQVDFNEALQSLTTKATAPEIIYNGSTINNLDFALIAEKDKLDFNFGIDSLNTGAIAMQKTSLSGYLKDQVIYSNFKAMDNENILIQMASEITKNKDTTSFHINPSGFIINKQNWDILPNNSIKQGTDFINFNAVTLTQNNQEISVNNTSSEKTAEAIEFHFKNFELSTFTSLLNQETLLASGKLNGDVIIENPLTNAGIIANASITNLQAMEVALGELSLNAKALENTKYELDLGISGDNLNINIAGNYSANSTDNPLDFNIDLQNLNLSIIEAFAKDYISKTSGNLAGKIKLTGALDHPKPVGDLYFNDAALTLNAFNAAFTLPKESIKLTDTGIYFNDFTMLDTNKNPFIIDGGILTENLTNPGFDFTLKAKNTEILNSTKEDNSLFYGKMNLNTNVSIGGNLNLPKVRGRLVINESSNFTYIIPESEVDIVEKQGVVLFVNKKDPDDILTRQNEDTSSPAPLKGFDINAELSIAEKATFNIVVDEQSGDNLKVSGTGDFNFGIAENGDMSLSGKYEVSQGHYEVSLYNLVKRKFDIDKGSSILWSGNPLEAEMDIRAIYEVETSASGLMASQLTGESSSVSNQYRQQIPFLVYLNLNGELLTPEISFNLDMPEDEQGELGGDVYTQVQQLNTQEEELNKQVFSLLVLNQFFPTTTSDGSSGGSLSIARDNANAVLSNQLNNFSNKLLGKSGIQLDFGLDSYTDYQGDAAVDKTQLEVNASKRLFNDRLIVEVGSGLDIQENSQNAGQTTPLVGTVNIQYLFDDIGRWRLKAYRKNDFESVIDGQVILTGIALIFNQEFNKFKELFAKAVQEDVDKAQKENELKKDQKKP